MNLELKLLKMYPQLSSYISSFASKYGDKLYNCFCFSFTILIITQYEDIIAKILQPEHLWTVNFLLPQFLSLLAHSPSFHDFCIPTKHFHSRYHSENSLKGGYSGAFPTVLLSQGRCYWEISLFMISGLS